MGFGGLRQTKCLCLLNTSSTSVSLKALANVDVQNFGHYGRCGIVVHCGHSFASLMTSEDEHLLMGLLAI